MSNTDLDPVSGMVLVSIVMLQVLSRTLLLMAIVVGMKNGRAVLSLGFIWHSSMMLFYVGNTFRSEEKPSLVFFMTN